MKNFIKKSFISILIIMVFFNFLLTPFQTSYAITQDDISDFLSFFNNNFNIFGEAGLTGMLLMTIRYSLLSVVAGLHTLVSSLAQIGNVKGVAPGTKDFFVTPFHIFFNRIEMLDVNFFDFSNTTSTMGQFRLAVAGWYYTMRLISAMALVVILIYIGIRMAISTVAQEKAMYQKMLVDWLTSLALLFVLHYIMVLTLMINEALIDAMYKIAKGTEITNFVKKLILLSFGWGAAGKLEALIAIGVYAMVVFQTFSFLLSYIKRMLNIGFLIIIAPLITITYSLDKIGDGKAQALNTWLKEFIYNILIQPFHCILYLSFAQIAYKLLSNDIPVNASSLARAVLAVLCIQYIKTGEEIVRKIFAFKADSLASMATGTAMAMAAMSQAGNVAKKVGSTAAGLSRTIGKNVNMPNLKTKFKEGAKQLKEQRNDRKIEKRAVKELQKGDKKKKIDKNSTEFQAAKNKAKMDIENEKKNKITKRVAKAQGKADGEKPDITGASGNTRKWRDSIANTKAVKAVKKAGTSVGNSVKKAGKTVGDVSSKVGEKFKTAANSPTATTLKDNFVKPLAGIPKGLADDAITYLSKHENQGKILSKAVGAVIGFGALGAGDFSSAVTGYKAGSGLIEGYYSNSTATLKEDMRGQGEVIARLTGEESGDNITALVWALGKAGVFEKMSDKIDQLVEKLKKEFSVDEKSARRVVNTMRSEIISDPKNVDQEFIEKTMKDEEDFKGLDQEDFKRAYQLIEEHAVLTSQSALYNSLKNCEKLDMDLETMGYIMGNFDNVSSRKTTTETETHTENQTETQTETTVHTKDVNYIKEPEMAPRVIGDAMNISSHLDSNSESVTREDIEKTNKSIEDLNNLLAQFDKAREDEKTKIIQAVNENNEIISRFNSGNEFETGIISAEMKFKDKIEELKDQIEQKI